MYRYPTILSLAVALALSLTYSATGVAAELVKAKDGSGVIGYKDTPILPWCGYCVHDPDRPAPKKVTPGKPTTEEKLGAAPSDAIVLFDGKDFSQ